MVISFPEKQVALTEKSISTVAQAVMCLPWKKQSMGSNPGNATLTIGTPKQSANKLAGN